MKKPVHRIRKRLIRLGLGLVVATSLWYVWFTRTPTTQLVDATGKELTAGTAVEGQEDGLGDLFFDAPRALIENRDFPAAKAMLLRMIEESDRDGQACILLCDVSRELGEEEAAADYGLKAVELLPDNAEAHLAYAKAIGAQMAIDMQSFGGMFSAMKRIGHFKAELDRVIELDPDDTEARTMLVFTNLAPKPFGDVDQAIELCEQIEARDPVAGKQLLAMCYQRKGEPERAITLLLAGIEAHPEENSFHAALADVYAAAKRFDDADTEYEAARLGGKDQTYYRSLYGQARMRIQNEFEPAKAIELLDEFIVDEPETDKMQSVAHACWRKGLALEQLGRKQDARAAYQESVRRDPAFELAKKSLAALPE